MKHLLLPFLTIFFSITLPCFAEIKLESFEGSVPESYTAEGGKISLSTERILDGKTALLWEMNAKGDALNINTGALGNVNVWTGYGGYSRSAITIPIYFETVGKGKLQIQIRAADQIAATIDVPFQHIGWQKLVYHYSHKSKMKWVNSKLKSKLDNIRIVTLELEAPTRLWLDAVHYNKPLDFRAGREAIAKAWHPKVHDFSERPAPSAEQLEKVDKLLTLMNPKPNPNVKKATWEKVIARHKAFVRDSKWSIGNPLSVSPSKVYPFLNNVATSWHQCADSESKLELEAIFHGVNDWLQEQGAVVNGAIGRQNNYVGRTYVDAITKMSEPLARHGNLEASLNFLKWSYYYDEQVFIDSDRSMDYFHNEAMRLLMMALCHTDPVTRWHHVNSFRENLAKQLINSIKPDGSIYHHAFHYYAYGSMGMNSISAGLTKMSAAGLPIPEAGLDKVKLALMQMRWYCGRTTLWSLCGRNTSGSQNIITGAYLNLAMAYRPYRNGKLDKELTRAYLRLNPQAAEGEVFSEFTAEASPTGFNTMPFAALSMHRRKDWLVGIKGFSKYVANGESYAHTNRHGLFMSMGQMELLTHPKPLPTVHGSGTRPDNGYNWSAIEGATTIHTPLDRIANGNGTRSVRNQETFVGGVGNGKNGIFSMKLTIGTGQIMRDRAKDSPAPSPLSGYKSWFCFDNRIVCIGSNISTQNVSYPVRTNLFQKFLTDKHTTTELNGEALTFKQKPVIRDTSDKSSTFIDPYGNAYFVPKNTTHLEISEQK